MDKNVQNNLPISLTFEFHSYIHSERGVIKHFHKNFEIITPLTGICVCKVNDQSFELSPGDCIIFFPFQAHEFDIIGDGSVQRIIFNDHLILTAAQSFAGMVPKDPVFRPEHGALDYGLKMLYSHFGANSGPIARITPMETRLRVKGFLYLLVSYFLGSSTLIPAPKRDLAVMDIALYIAENFKSNVSLKDIAKDKGYNYQYLSRTFNRYMNINFKKLLNYYRIHRAFAMLQDTDMPISHIAFECGFKSIRSFNQVSRDVFGATPKELRRMRQI